MLLKGSEVDINALRRLWTWDIVAFEEESSKIKLMGLLGGLIKIKMFLVLRKIMVYLAGLGNVSLRGYSVE